MQDPALVFTLAAPVCDSPAVAAARPPSVRGHKALWFIGMGLLVNAAVMLYTHAGGAAGLPDLVLDRAALAQAVPGEGQPLGARGIYMMPAQLGPQEFGLYLMDVDSSTICVYRALPQTSRFQLMAARSFKNDRFLEDMNNDSPNPKQVQGIIEGQRRSGRNCTPRDKVPTVPQTPKPDENLARPRIPDGIK